MTLTWSTRPAWRTTSATRRSGTTASRRWPSSPRGCGGFEGNAQSLRLLTRLEAKVPGAGLNLTRATLDATLKYPWLARGRPGAPGKYGVYADDAAVFAWIRGRRAGRPAAAWRRRSWTGPTTSPTRCTTWRTACTPA